jgi:hypothetical protein
MIACVSSKSHETVRSINYSTMGTIVSFVSPVAIR